MAIQLPRGDGGADERHYSVWKSSAQGTLDLCVVLHELGPGSRWAARCAVGDRVEISRSRAIPIALDRSVEAHLFLGDETSIAAADALIRNVAGESGRARVLRSCLDGVTAGPSARLPVPKRFTGWIAPGDPARPWFLGSRAKSSRSPTPRPPT